ncbi:hypothetical protein [Nitrospirillum viridazoti]|uniref:Uncharacterized protein n=1 Tax=Nitrospirillum viridazoti CBAmc TaxID=1441467 RepID=A0A248JQC3_9PROT|nr:hypothetical protein [Nitrospirillum amazonense]ASG20932.1 hypothetical protein Y958_08960 [Nitrospirillum amazonense CBAmc]TWB37720.1 hypothetical protein FBZ91_10733 [Nitrospirillum amazonense]
MSGVQTPSIITQTAGAGGGAAPTVLGQVTVTQLPDKLTGLARALAVSGMVTEQQGEQATVRTAAGDVQVRTEAPLPTDRPVTLQIPAQTTGAALTATVVAQAATQGAAQGAAQTGGSGQAAAAAQPQPQPAVQLPNPAAGLPALQVGTTLAAVLLNPAPASNSASTPAPNTQAPVSDVNQGQGLGLIVGARGDTGDQPDLTDDSPQQSPNQPAPSPTATVASGSAATAPQTSATAPGTGAGATDSDATTGTGQPSSTTPSGTTLSGASPSTALPAASGQNTPTGTPVPASAASTLANLLFAQTTVGMPGTGAGASPPSLADLLPGIAPTPQAPVPSGGGAPATATPGPDGQPTTGVSSPAPSSANPAPTQTATPSPIAPVTPGTAAPDTGPAGTQAPPTSGAPFPTPTQQPAPQAPPQPTASQPAAFQSLGHAATLLSALGVPEFLPDLGPSKTALTQSGAATPVPQPGAGPSATIVPPVTDEAPFVSGGLFLSAARPSFVRTGLPSGTAAPFSPLPAGMPPQGQPTTLATPPAAAPIPSAQAPQPPTPQPTAPQATTVAAAPLTNLWAQTTPASAGQVPSPQAPTAPPALAVPAGQAGPSAAMGGGMATSPLGVPSQPSGMAPATTLAPGSSAPQAALPGTPLPAPAGAYTPPLRTPTSPSPGQTLSFTLLSVQRPGMPLEAAPAAGPGILPPEDAAEAPLNPALARPGVLPPLAGTVVALTRTGQPVVETPRGTLLLQARADLPVGTKVQLATAAAAPELDAVPPPIDPARGRDWPALREALAVIAASDPALAHQLINSVLPRPTPQLTKTLVVFLAALRGGDASGWLGSEAMSTLSKAGRGRLSARLTDDFNSIATQAAEPNKEGWRTFAVPFGDEVGRLQVHVRAINDEESEEEEGGARGVRNRPLRRFLIDLQLSQLGPMQLDGLIWTGRFDLVIRTRQLLPSSLTRELHGIYSNSLAAVGYSGGLAFQTGAHGWVDHAASAGSGGMGPATRI